MSQSEIFTKLEPKVVELELRLNKLENDYSKLEPKVVELELRLDKLENDYSKDIHSILRILKKIELRVSGGGLDDPEEIGLINEVRGIKRDIGNHKIQSEEIQKIVQEIKCSLPQIKQLIEDIDGLKKKIRALEKYRWMLWGGFITLGWLVMSYSGLGEIIKHIVK